MPDESDSHRVYYNRRKNGQFLSGKSGNPSGRPKKSLSTENVLRAMLLSKVAVVRDGKREVLTVVEAMAERVKREALTGPIRGLEKGIAVAQKYSFLDPVSEEPEADLSRLSDEELRIYGRIAAKAQGILWDDLDQPCEDDDRESGGD